MSVPALHDEAIPVREAFKYGAIAQDQDGPIEQGFLLTTTDEAPPPQTQTGSAQEEGELPSTPVAWPLVFTRTSITFFVRSVWQREGLEGALSETEGLMNKVLHQSLRVCHDIDCWCQIKAVFEEYPGFCMKWGRPIPYKHDQVTAQVRG